MDQLFLGAATFIPRTHSSNWTRATVFFPLATKSLKVGFGLIHLGGQICGQGKDNVKSVLRQERNVQILRIALKGNRYIESKLYPNSASGYYCINESSIAIQLWSYDNMSISSCKIIAMFMGIEPSDLLPNPFIIEVLRGYFSDC